MTEIDIKQLLEKAKHSNVGKSTRRILFNHLDRSLEERGYFHVDWMYGSGSGILLKFDSIYFLLTAKHVLTNNISGGFQNESPFWVSTNFHSRWKTLSDFMFPRRVWNISDVIEFDMPGVDPLDICLIELFQPLPGFSPDHYINVVDPLCDLLEYQQFSDDMLLIISGYPFRTNKFSYENPLDGFTHTTEIQRQLVPGFLRIKDRGEMLITYELTDTDVNHYFLNGMSGGAVFNIKLNTKETKLAGINLSGGNNLSRFYPSFAFANAISQYRNCTSQIIDPASYLSPDYPPSNLSVEEKELLTLLYSSFNL
jgi:hypothetical protein